MQRTKTKGRKRASFPKRFSDGSCLIHFGIIADADFSGALMRHETLRSLGHKPGDFLEIQCVSQDTVVTRVLGCADCAGYDGLRPDYIYVDEQTAHYLGTDLMEIVRVLPGAYTFEIP